MNMAYENYSKVSPPRISDFQSSEVTLTKAKYGWYVSATKIPTAFAKFKTDEKTGKTKWYYIPETLEWWRPTKKWAKASAERVFLKGAKRVMKAVNTALQEETYTLDLTAPRGDYR